MSMSVPGNSCSTSRCCTTRIATSSSGCAVTLPGTCVYYSGSAIPLLGINPGDNFDIVVNKLSQSSGIQARNGLSVEVSGLQKKVVFGQNVGQSGNPALLLSDREIPMGSHSVVLKDGNISNTLRSNSISLINSTTSHTISISTADPFGNTLSLFTSNPAANCNIILGVLGSNPALWGLTASATDLRMMWNDGFSSPLTGFKMFPTADLQFPNYPSTRNDGPTTSAVYMDIDGNLKYGPISVSSSSLRIISAQSTSPVVVSASTDVNKIFTNEGATGVVIFELPPASAGLTYTFVSQNSNNITIQAAIGNTLQIGLNVSAPGGLISTTDVGSSIELVAINSTEWISISTEGTWVV